jgi:hypothetical protein
MTNTPCSDQFCSNSWLCISGRTFPIRKTSICVHQFSPVKIMFFFKLFTKENCQIWCRNPILPKFKAYNFSIIMTKGIKMASIIMWHDISSYLNQLKIKNHKLIILICWTLLDHPNHCASVRSELDWSTFQHSDFAITYIQFQTSNLTTELHCLW